MWPVFMTVLKRYTPYITLPFAVVVGFVGYHVEGWISDRSSPSTIPILQQRHERYLENIDYKVIKKKHDPLNVNLSPSLSS